MELVRNFYRDFVWIFGMKFCMDTCLGVWNTTFCVESLFGLVVVLNGRKICIEKMLGFRGDAVRFFNPCFCFGHHSSKLRDSNLWVN